MIKIHAQKIIYLTDTTPITVIGKNTLLFEDKDSKLGFEEVSSAKFEDKFIESTTEIPNFKVTQSKVWAKVRFANNSSHNNWYLQCTNANVEYIDLYFKDAGGKFIKQSSGFLTPIKERKTKIRHPVFALDLPKDSVVTFYVSMQDVVPLQIYLSVGSGNDFFGQLHTTDILNGAFFGLLFMLVIYNFFIYFSVRDKVYLYYIFYIISNAWFISFTTGYAVHLPAGINYIFQHHPSWVPFTLGASSCLFAIVFLDMKKTYPLGYKLSVGILIALFSVPLADLLGTRQQSIILVQFFGLTFSVLSLFIGVKVWRKGYKPAKFYLIAWTFYLAGLFVYISADLQIIPFNNFTHNAAEIGTAIEAVLLSMAVGDKISNYKKDKELAQEDALESARKNEQLVKEQNIILEQKVKARTHELEEQKEIVEEKNKEIVDSINYAKRIQYTLLAPEAELKQYLPEHFVLFKPKDIVSGDFYWATAVSGSMLEVPGSEDPKKKREMAGLASPSEANPATRNPEYFYLAICDSTGHGVPGAFMSLLNISFLNEAITERQIRSPEKILNYVRDRLVESVSQDGQQDGFDGILLKIEINGSQGLTESLKIEYAAANNSPVLISNNILTDLPCDKMPVGKGEKDQSFTLHTVDMKKGDTLYLYTDGYPDQFGGPKGKKYKYKQLNNLLLETYTLSAESQKEILDKRFEEWRGELEQVDDVTIIGVRV